MTLLHYVVSSPSFWPLSDAQARKHLSLRSPVVHEDRQYKITRFYLIENNFSPFFFAFNLKYHRIQKNPHQKATWASTQAAQLSCKWQLVLYGVLRYSLTDSVCLERMVLGRTGNGGALNCLGKVSLKMAWHNRSPHLLIKTERVWGLLIMPGQLYLQVDSRCLMCKLHSASWIGALLSSTVQPKAGRSEKLYYFAK